MNGLNGMMEEPMDTNELCSPINNGKTAVPDNDAETNHCENSNNTEDSSHMDSDVSQGTAEPCNNGELTNDNIDSLDCRSNDVITVIPAKKNSNNIVDNNFSNSNESSESVDSHNRKTPDQQPEGCDEKSKDCDLVVDQKTIANEETDEVDSEEDSSDDDDESETSTQVRAEETVSINSDSEHEIGDDTTLDKQNNKLNNSDVIIIENDILPESQNGDGDSPSPDIQEILSDNEENDDCIVTEESSVPIVEEVNDKTQLRRSRRMTPRKKYADDDMENGDESDVEEVQMVDPLSKHAKIRPIIISDTKSLAEMAAKQTKNQSNNQKRQDQTFVIIDSNAGGSSNKSKSQTLSSNSTMNAQIYQNIVARGTTVTPVSAKSNSVAQTISQTPQPAILPSLTDDMFVVEAPSFIVPYVYEKPSVKPFREFVDKLGKELEELRAKEEQEQLERDKERKEQEEKERKVRSEDVAMETASEAKPDEEDNEEQKKKKKKERRRRRNDDDDASWDGESSGESDDDVISDEDKTVVIKDKVDTIENIKEVTGLSVEKVVTAKTDNYFDCSLGKFFINIGLNLVQEYVQNDLLKQQNRKLQREKKSGANTRATLTAVASLSKNLEFSKETNAPYKFPQNKCEFCSFKTESKLVMSHHLETPHMKNNVYKCNYCVFEIRSPHDILYHMENEHKVRGKLERAPAYHQCANCPFEDNGKGKLARHLIPCAKKFKPDSNLAPPIEWEPPAKIPKIARSRNTSGVMGTYQSAFNRAAMAGANRLPLTVGATRPPLTVGAVGGAYRPRGRSPMPAPPRAVPPHGLPIARTGLVVRHSPPVPVGIITPNNFSMANNSKNSKSSHQPSISITPLPRQPHPPPPTLHPSHAQHPQHPHPSHHAKNTFVICEICDGYIKDLEQLRNHMQWIHKVKIHPKMIYNRPPLNCQKCQFRFFTDQGLERHLLGSHGLVTSSMQEAANKGKDAGRCPVCGRVYQWKLLNHVGRDHNLTLKPAHLSYKCTVCTATFGMYKQFENHVYSAHSVVAKRVMDKNKSAPPPAKGSNDSLLKPLKINDEITIIPQPATASRSTASAGKDK